MVSYCDLRKLPLPAKDGATASQSLQSLVDNRAP